MDGVYITEDYKNRTPSFAHKIKPINKKEEFYTKAESFAREEVLDFIKRTPHKK
jgi:hypothetical protein